MYIHIEIIIIFLLFCVSYLIYYLVILNKLTSEEKSDHPIYQVRSFCNFISYMKYIKKENLNPLWIYAYVIVSIMEIAIIIHLFIIW